MKSIVIIIISFLSLFTQANDPIKERQQFLDQVFELLETNVANPAWLKDPSYEDFKETMYSEKALSMEEQAFYKFFNKKSNDLPFTHFYLNYVKTPASKQKEASDVLYWKALNENTAYLGVEAFWSDPTTMIKAIEEIGTDRFENLIIDLRRNGGGTLDGPVILGQFLTSAPIDAGIHLTRKWFEKEARPATMDDIKVMPFLQDFTFKGIRKMFEEHPAFRMVIPGHDRPVFKGKVYVLVSNQTGSACEPLIDLFKKKGIATLVGESSGGAMLSAEYFPVNEQFKVFIPIADYQTAEGNRIDKIGVTPDIEVPAEKALDYTLEKLIK